jgi:hypothetical protein
MRTIFCRKYFVMSKKSRKKTVIFERECAKIQVINCEILKFHVFNARSVGSCNLVLYEKDIPEIYQNFDSIPGVADRDLARAGSSVILADYCPYVQVLYTVKKISDFPVPSRDVIYQTLSGREFLNFSQHM